MDLAGRLTNKASQVPTMLIHGLSETDADGSAVWRVREWVDKEPFGPTYFPEGRRVRQGDIQVDVYLSWFGLVVWGLEASGRRLTPQITTARPDQPLRRV